jgi:hypothetical protein
MGKAAVLLGLLMAAVAGCASEDVASNPAPEPAFTADAPPKSGAASSAPGAPSAASTGSTGDPTPAPAPPGKASVVAWYTDGLTTGTGSANDLSALKVDADSVTVAQLTTLIETNKYNGQPRDKTKPADFDEVFLSRAQNAAFMAKMGKAVAQVVADGYPQVIVYSNGPRCIAESAKGAWLPIAKAGAVIGLEAYTTTLTADIMAANTAHPFVDVDDVEGAMAANPDLFAAWETLVQTYVTNTKAALGNDETLFDHITLLQYEDMSHDIDMLQKSGMTAPVAQHFAALWYAALKSAATKENVHWGVWHPA